MEEKLQTLGQMLELSPTAQLLFSGETLKALSGAARKLFPGAEPGARLQELLGDYAGEYRAFSGKGTLLFSGRLAGLPCEITVTALDELRLVTVLPTNETMGIHSLGAITVNLRQALSAVTAAKGQLLPLLEENQENMNTAAQLNQGLFAALRMTGNLELYYSIANGGPELHLLWADLGAWLEGMVRQLEPLTEMTGRKLLWSCPAECCGLVMDVQLMGRALLNLVSNAIKFSEAGSEIRLQLRRREGLLVLSVQDQGCGIPADRMGLIYNWSRHKGQFPDPRWGMGLGLFLVRRILESHGGRLLIESQEGQGTKAYMALPTTRKGGVQAVHSSIQVPDYAGGMRHTLLELADALPAKAYDLRGIDL